MLRWFVLVLLLCNGIYFGWQRYLAPPAATSGFPLVEPQGRRVALLSETGVPAVARPAPAPAVAANASAESALAPSVEVSQPVTTGAPPEAPAAPICHLIGPFHEKISARQVRDRLTAIPVRVDLYQINVPSKPVYWVYLGPMRSRQEAQEQHRQLVAKNIESFIISEGPLLNGVSLGFFTVPESAQAMLKQRRDQGYDAKLREVSRTTPEMWLVFAEGEFNRFSDALWQQVRSGTLDIELRKSLCDVVATAEKLE